MQPCRAGCLSVMRGPCYQVRDDSCAIWVTGRADPDEMRDAAADKGEFYTPQKRGIFANFPAES